jgi:hypothetical protein
MLDGHAATISPADPDSAIVALRVGLFRTSDQGKGWQAMPLPGEVQHIYSVACG